jgi:hypothetical protein
MCKSRETIPLKAFFLREDQLAPPYFKMLKGGGGAADCSTHAGRYIRA